MWNGSSRRGGSGVYSVVLDAALGCAGGRGAFWSRPEGILRRVVVSRSSVVGARLRGCVRRLVSCQELGSGRSTPMSRDTLLGWWWWSSSGGRSTIVGLYWGGGCALMVGSGEHNSRVWAIGLVRVGGFCLGWLVAA